MFDIEPKVVCSLKILRNTLKQPLGFPGGVEVLFNRDFQRTSNLFRDPRLYFPSVGRTIGVMVMCSETFRGASGALQVFRRFSETIHGVKGV